MIRIYLFIHFQMHALLNANSDWWCSWELQSLLQENNAQLSKEVIRINSTGKLLMMLLKVL